MVGLEFRVEGSGRNTRNKAWFIVEFYWAKVPQLA